MKDLFDFTEYKVCGVEDPTEDGQYVVFRVYRSEYGDRLSSVTTLEFTTEYGWNANERCTDTVIDFTEDEDYLSVWTKVTYIGDSEGDKNDGT